jgi:hypothetical protein
MNTQDLTPIVWGVGCPSFLSRNIHLDQHHTEQGFFVIYSIEEMNAMNVYLCDAGEMQVFVEVVAEWPRYEWERVFNIVAASTRAKAKKLFIDENGSELEWISPMSIRKIGEFDVEVGILDDYSEDSIPYWDAIYEKGLFNHPDDQQQSEGGG